MKQLSKDDTSHDCIDFGKDYNAIISGLYCRANYLYETAKCTNLDLFLSLFENTGIEFAKNHDNSKVMFSFRPNPNTIVALNRKSKLLDDIVLAIEDNDPDKMLELKDIYNNNYRENHERN